MITKMLIRFYVFNLLLFMVQTKIWAGENCWSTSGPEGGSVNDIALSTDNPNIILTATSHGGIYKSVNGGQTWQYVTGQNEYGVFSDILDPNVFYFWGSHGLYRYNSIVENIETLFGNFSGSAMAFLQHSMNPNRLFLGFYKGYAGPLFIGNVGVYSSDDYGLTWYPLTRQGLSNLDIIDMKFSPSDSSILYAATKGGVFKYSMEQEQWENISSNVGRKQCISIFTQPPNIIYLGTESGLYRKSENENDWEDITGEIFKSRFIYFATSHEISANQIILFAATMDGLYKSSNSGDTWEEINNGLTGHEVYTLEAQSVDTLFLGTMDGFYKSVDGGNNWIRSVSGMTALDTRAITFDNRTEPTKVLTASSAGIHVSTDKGESWNVISPFRFITTNLWSIETVSKNPDIMYALYIDGFDSLQHVRNGIIKSVDGGETWMEISGPLSGLFPLKLAVNPIDTNILYCGTNYHGLYKSEDAGKTWVKETNGLPSECSVHAITIDPHQPSIVYASLVAKNRDLKQGIFKSEDNGETWAQTSFSTVVGNTWIAVYDIAINPLNSETLFAASNAGLWKSNNGGMDWYRTDPALFGNNGNQLFSVCIDPSDTNNVFCAGRKIYYSADSGSKFHLLMDGLPEFVGIVNDIKIDPNDPSIIYAATNGYGVYVYHHTSTELNTNVQISTPVDYTLSQNYPNPFNPSTRIKYHLPVSCHVSLCVYNVKGQIVKILLDGHKSAGYYSTQWNATDEHGNRVSSGVYFYELRAEDFSAIKKMVLAQ